MSVGMERIRERVREHLTRQGVNAVTAWPAEKRQEVTEPVVVVSLRECRAEPAGFQNYLGERYNRDTGLWEECYGRKAQLVFGLDLYAPARGEDADIQAAFDKLVTALTGEGPEGLHVEEVACEETHYDTAARLQVRRAKAVCQAYLYAVERPGESFLDFELRGGLQA